jgi:signal transduction histidine kinase
MNYRKLQIVTVLLPTLLIGGFEYFRHDVLLSVLSMEAGNAVIVGLTFAIFLFFSTWMFRLIRRTQDRLAEEESRRAVYEERERLARELHDGIAQSLFYLNVKLKQGKVEDARTAVASIDHQVRQAIFNLRSDPEQGTSLAQRLADWCAQWSALTGIEVTQELDIPRQTFTAAQEVQLFGMIQEGFANIRKHSGARQASVKLTATGDAGWELAIRDDGGGFNESNLNGKTYGLSMLKERADKLGASFSIACSATDGTELLFTSQTAAKRASKSASETPPQGGTPT